VVWSEETDNRAVSSAYVPTIIFSFVGRSDEKGVISLS